MKVTNNQIANASTALQVLAGMTGDTVIRFRINQNVKSLAPHVEAWQESRKEIVDKYVEKNDDGQPCIDEEESTYIWQDGKKDEAVKALEELAAIETDVNVAKIKLSRLAEHVDKAIDYQVISMLDWLIDDDMD